MNRISQFNLGYDPNEDRVACNVEDPQGVTTRLWLTQRICRGLVGALVPILEAATPQVTPEHRATVQSWEQAAAMDDLSKAPRPPPKPASDAALVQAVRITTGEGRVRLLFECGPDQAHVLDAMHPTLRQTLFVLRGIYQAVGWPLDIWPAWVSEAMIAPSADTVN